MGTKSKPRCGAKRMGRSQIAVGDHILIGLAGISMPMHWSIALVLWVGPQDVVVDRQSDNGTRTFRDVIDLANVRAIGTLSEVIDIKLRAEADVLPLVRAKARAEEALAEATRAVFLRLDEFAAAEPMRQAGGGI